MGWRSHHLGLWPLRLKLGLTPPNRHCIDGTHDSIERRIKNRDRKMAKDPCDSQRKNELNTGCRIPIDIYDRDNEMKGKFYGNIL